MSQVHTRDLRTFECAMPKLGRVNLRIADVIVHGDNRIYLVVVDPTGEKHVFGILGNGMKFVPKEEKDEVIALHDDELARVMAAIAPEEKRG